MLTFPTHFPPWNSNHGTNNFNLSPTSFTTSLHLTIHCLLVSLLFTHLLWWPIRLCVRRIPDLPLSPAAGAGGRAGIVHHRQRAAPYSLHCKCTAHFSFHILTVHGLPANNSSTLILMKHQKVWVLEYPASGESRCSRTNSNLESLPPLVRECRNRPGPLGLGSELPTLDWH